jgi:hypothetical protein
VIFQLEEWFLNVPAVSANRMTAVTIADLIFWKGGPFVINQLGDQKNLGTM